jgi:hypothetical protein
MAKVTQVIQAGLGRFWRLCHFTVLYSVTGSSIVLAVPGACHTRCVAFT